MWRFEDAKCIRSPGKPNYGMACARRAKHPRDLFDVNMIGDVVHTDAPDKLRHGKAFQFEVENHMPNAAGARAVPAGRQSKDQGRSDHAAKGIGYRKIAREVGLGVGTVMRPTAPPGDRPPSGTQARARKAGTAQSEILIKSVTIGPGMALLPGWPHTFMRMRPPESPGPRLYSLMTNICLEAAHSELLQQLCVRLPRRMIGIMASITPSAKGTQFLLAFRAALSAWLALGSFAGLVACGPDTDSVPRAGAAHSPTKQMQRLRQDADQGSRLAQYVLGVMYQLGEIVPQDYAEAAKWVQRAADQDFTVAQFVLGEMYAVGHGVPNDDVRAHMWLSLSETRAAHIDGAQKLENDARAMRTMLEVRMKPAQIAEAQQLAGEWKPKPER